MESFRYVNIFETKGLEYLLLIIFLALFVLFVRYLRRTERAPDEHAPPQARGSAHAATRPDGDTA